MKILKKDYTMIIKLNIWGVAGDDCVSVMYICEKKKSKNVHRKAFVNKHLDNGVVSENLS